jgi:NAD(P)-dependent dehydrogenase (short-subunit alcohol dehydrogenase family)
MLSRRLQCLNSHLLRPMASSSAAAAAAPPLAAAFSLTGKSAVVTGASKGIGAAIAQTFAAAGAEIVAIIGRDTEGLAATKQLVEAEGRTCHVVAADFSTAQGVAAAADQLLAVSPCWDILCNNHGTNAQTPLAPAEGEDADGFAFDGEAFSGVVDTNLRSVVQLVSRLAPGMIDAGRGAIVNVSSMQAFFGLENQIAYGSSKAALNQATRVMAVELGPRGIRANAVAPGVTLTKMGRDLWDSEAMVERKAARLKSIPLQRFAEPEDIAKIALFLASDASLYLTGQCLQADGGWNIAP